MQSHARGWAVRRSNGTYDSRWYKADGGRGQKKGLTRKRDAETYAAKQAADAQKIRDGVLVIERPSTVDELLDLYVEEWAKRVGTKKGRPPEANTVRTRKTELKHAREKFGSRSPDSLKRVEVESWRLSLSRGSQHGAFRSFPQALSWAVRYGYLERNASDGIANPAPRRHERRPVHPFASWSEIEAVASEHDKRYAAIPIVGAATMLRPEEIFGLDRADVTYYDAPRNGDFGTLRIHQRFTDGTLKAGTKNGTPERIVPFGKKVYDALKAMTPRIDTPILFPAPRGGRIDIEEFRHREWTPAVRAAGIGHHRVYDLRSTGITWMLTAGVPSSRVARLAGTSTKEIEETYDRWIPSNEGFGGAIDGYGKAVNE